ncbi:histidine phosphatase family protein [Chengkuizengella axinellae]|uniref:Histidine phosphatase family protein n=1 Tax=Chengkuizengella axinellae TaxID=3064388 RepID=A0ABT9IXY7_9BACL|nr:histidine phosphatase family protein [Chengkuizengella sp. 2205SS18-9]MDP5274221.1 histidine phosphatase family protein [Chengkuizengella sp. 2205SS18-9]
MDIYLIRHGQTEANLLNKEKYTMFTGQYESPLTIEGEEQALKLSRSIKNMKFDKVYSSDLSRAVRTAEIVFPKNNINQTPLLRERSLGFFEGKRIDDLSNKEEYSTFNT